MNRRRLLTLLAPLAAVLTFHKDAAALPSGSMPKRCFCGGSISWPPEKAGQLKVSYCEKCRLVYFNSKEG